MAEIAGHEVCALNTARLKMKIKTKGEEPEK